MAIEINRDKPLGRTHGGTLEFAATVDGKPVTCEISEAALQDHFGAGDETESLVAAFEKGRRDIELLALMKLNIDPFGKCHIGTDDFKNEEDTGT